MIGYTQLANLIEGRVDAAVVYANNEPVQLEQTGHSFVQFIVADEVVLVSNGIIANETVVEENPELVRAFVRAFLKGLRDTLNDPDSAFEICIKCVEGLQGNVEVQRAGSFSKCRKSRGCLPTSHRRTTTRQCHPASPFRPIRTTMGCLDIGYGARASAWLCGFVGKVQTSHRQTLRISRYLVTSELSH